MSKFSLSKHILTAHRLHISTSLAMSENVEGFRALILLSNFSSARVVKVLLGSFK